MANVIQTASNRFSKGLVLDFSPENTSSESLSHALNATFLTFNGNEQSLQNDMGNARVETAYLPEGYIPVGTCEYGGIIYIVSYNPLEDKSQIGCFPSPERNINSEELGKSSVQINADAFQKFENGQATGELIHTSFNALLKDDKLNPGDKFLISVNDITDEAIKDLETNSILKDNPMVVLNVVSIEDSGKVVYLNSELRKYENTINSKEYKYHMVMKQASDGEGSTAKHVDPTANDIDKFRSILSSGYNVFKSKTSGKLAILAELITIDSYSITHSIVPSKEDGEFDVVIHTEVSPSITDKNYLTVPKLKYYYLEKSQGYLSTFNQDGSEAKIPLYQQAGNEIKYNDAFFKDLSDIYVGTGNIDKLKNEKLKQSQFLFPKAHSYHVNLNHNQEARVYYTEFIKGLYYRILVSQIYPQGYTEDMKKQRLNFFHERFAFYKEMKNVTSPSPMINDFPEINDFLEINYLSEINDLSEINTLEYVYLTPFKTIYISNEDFLCSLYDNRIWDLLKDYKDWDMPQLYDKIPTFLAGNNNQDLEYSDVNLASLKIPNVLYENGIDLPFKYDYTVVPCMRFGRLNHLAISNTVDFSKLHAFNKSNFNVWKYHIDGNQLRLTFGAEVFDTFEEDKVDALILEFYDHRGFAGSLEINNKKSYSGIFTKIITLNSYNELSKQKVDIDKHIYHSNYKHNVNITKKEEIYYLNDVEVEYKDEIEGWNIKNEDNDCGVLYSNLIYGVKAYFRKSNQSGYTFIHKKEMVLFTFPIHNDHFYNMQDFNQLVNPKLSFVMTHRLQDSGKPPKPYEDVDYGIYQGYDEIDKQLVTKYLSGQYKDTSNISLVKYYEYAGESKLSLEIGLQENYLSWNLRNNPNINEKFSCTLKLIGKSENESILIQPNTELNDIESLNYKNYDLNKKNILSFDKGENELKITAGMFQKYNFLNGVMTQIPIYYSFKIGYKTSVSNIAKTQIPATTICALFHKKPDGEMNLSDFGLYKYKDGDATYYLNDPIFYNGGSSSEELFGVGKINTYDNRYADGKTKNIFEQTTLYDITSNVAKESTQPGQLNTQVLKEYKHLIGKLSFGQPHAHVVDTLYGINISPNADGWGIYSEWGNWKIETGDKDDTYGIAPDYNDTLNLTSLYIDPIYNLCVNTKESINNNFNFISTLDFKLIQGKQRGYDYDYKDKEDYSSNTTLRKYTGFNANQLAWFNNQLLISMKYIYAYNPDYDFLELQKGDVSLQNYSPSFTTNLVVYEAKLTDKDKLTDEYTDLKNINQYIYLGPIVVSDYIQDLGYFCQELNPSLIQFTADLKGCGAEEYSLISSLTYNTQIPQALVDDLTMDTSARIVIKHSDGTLQFVTGEYNKTSLYGYTNELNPGIGNLVELDVDNYKIYEQSEASATTPKTAQLEIITDKLYWDVGEDRILPINTLEYEGNQIYKTLISYKNTVFNDVYVQLICNNLIKDDTQKLIQDPDNIYNFYLIADHRDEIQQFNLNFNFNFVNNKNLYKADSANTVVRIWAQPLTQSPIFINELFRQYGEKNSLSSLNALLDMSKNTEITYMDSNIEKTFNTEDILKRGQFFVNKEKQNNNVYDGNTKDIKSWYIQPLEGEYSIQCVLYRIQLFDTNNINYIGYAKKDWSVEPFFIHTDKTKDYSIIYDRRYFVKDEYSQAQFRGSTITINDLEYDPNPNGHRLFLKQSRYKYDDEFPRGQIYYRKLEGEKNTWKYSSTKNLNHLYMYTGPCYKVENLDQTTEPIHIN